MDYPVTLLLMRQWLQARLGKQFWSSWARETGARLVLCSASAEAFELAADGDFSVEGLGELMKVGLNSHKVVSFG